MSAATSGSEDPKPSVAPSRSRRRRPKPPPSAYRGTPPPSIDLPPGHGAKVFPLPTSTGFVGEEFSMDSMEFMRWAALRYDGDRFVLVVLFTLMGSQEPGGLIEATQEQVADSLGYSRSHVARVYNVLETDGALRKVRRGVYQLNPAVSLRGGLRKPRNASRSADAKAEKVDQLALLFEIREDLDAPEAFRELAASGAKLDTRPKPGTPEGGTS
ncbi:helix-turn-helix domain-containing protein [Streptacidiphilus carbonis]|uniref:helix-turn-helix domain-containing protein n=1 Tax=Streptacidiphilus carbonis TaxID=105422 RepID=UPI000693EA35|nr:helix-turn-helix domain-containing protein [Streptacidiphilus carbonis]